MSGSEHWLFQGRQEHGWFGHGTAPAGEAGENRLFDPKNAADRVDYAATSLIGHVPRGERARWAPSFSDTTRGWLKTAVAARYGASGLSRKVFKALLLDPYTSDETVDRLRRAAREIVEARTYDDLGKAGDNLSAAAPQMLEVKGQIIKNSDWAETKQDIMMLYNHASKIQGWQKADSEESIEVGEYALALDGIAYVYIDSKKVMPVGLFNVFERLASEMKLEERPEYEGVTILRKSNKII